jgi:hypothetical protein
MFYCTVYSYKFCNAEIIQTTNVSNDFHSEILTTLQTRSNNGADDKVRDRDLALKIPVKMDIVYHVS